MRIQEIQTYCDENGIRREFVEACRERNIRRADSIKKEILARRELLENLKSLINDNQTLQGAYFGEPGNKERRKYTEWRYNYDELQWEEGGHNYSAAIAVSCSSRNVYVDRNFYRDGVKTTMTAIKNSYQRMRDELFKAD